jgi:hypothetical protein
MVRTDPVGVGAGARFRVHKTNGWMDSIIAAVEAPYKISEQGHSGRLNMVPTHTVWELVEAPGPGGCELQITFWTDPKGLSQKMRERSLKRKLARGWKKTAERLKALIESEGPVEHVGIAGESRLGL